MALSSRKLAFAALPSLLLAGCTLIESDESIADRSILQAATAADDSATLDIYWVRLPAGLEDAELWGEVSEDRLPVDLRRRLASNGLRAGVVGTKPPDALLRLLDPDGLGDVSSDGAAELRDTGVRRRTRQIRPGQEIDLAASEVVDEAPLLVARDGRLTGRTYRQVQGIYSLSIDRAEDDRVVLRLLPEVQHGTQQLRFVSDETGAISRGTLSRDAETSDDLQIDAPLAAGEMLLLANLPESGSRLGGLFHGSSDERKALVVRVSQAPPSRAFAPSE